MYNKKVSRITFDIEKYPSEDDMFKDVAKVLQILTKNGEICTFEHEDCGIYVLQHNYSDIDFGTLYPYWVFPEDYEDYILYKEYKEESEEESEEEEHNEEPEE